MEVQQFVSAKPVLSLFPGIGLLDMAFEEAGFCVVRGPDLIWGGDICKFHPQPGSFSGIIGGPPCQAFSPLRHLVIHNGHQPAPNRIPEFERCVLEAQPSWFIMENVEDAPLPVVEGYQVHSQILNNRTHGGGIQRRVRRISFGTKDGRQLFVPTQEEPEEYAPAVLAGGLRRTDIKQLRHDTNYKALKEMQRLQGLPDDFELPAFKLREAVRAVGNGVPLPLGRAIAQAVKEAMYAPVTTKIDNVR